MQVDTWISEVLQIGSTEEGFTELKGKVQDAECLSQLVGIIFQDEAVGLEILEFGA